MANRNYQVGQKRARRSYHDYTIALFCVLTVEVVALRYMLDEVHDDVSVKSTNTYIFGSLSNHNVVIVVVTEPGNTHSGIVAARFCEDFPSIRLGLVVGVGGGVPGKHGQNGIRLGDVVVAEGSSKSAAVVQFDKGKYYASSGFELSGHLNKPPPELIGLVKKLKAQHHHHANKIPHLITDMMKRYPTMAYEYTSPGPDQDQLYDASYEHVGGDDCANCSKGKVLERPIDTVDQPRIHYGTIGTSNCVVKSAIERERLGGLYDVLCVEMEAAGIVDQIPCLVVRGICDYADSHKNKKWQPYAAVTAAAYVKELLEGYSSRSEYQMVVPVQVTTRSPEDESQYQALLKSLTFPRMDARVRGVLQPLPRTGEWLREHHEFRTWMDQDKRNVHHGFLWVGGKPGSGKSTLMKLLLTWESRKKQQHDTVSFFFNARAPTNLEKSSEGLYRSLTHQLIVACPGVQSLFSEQFSSKQNNGEVEDWTVEELKPFLIEAISEHLQRPLVILIDALDEGDEADIRQLVSFLEDLAESAHSNDRLLRICLSSRHYPHISIKHGVELVVEKQAGHEKDIEKYIHQKLRDDKSTAMEELRLDIHAKSDSVFLWIVLVIPMLNEAFDRGEKFNASTMSRRLKKIPQKLDDLFADIIAKSEQDLGDCLTALQWVLYSKQSLSLTQLYLAVSVTSTSTRFDMNDLSPERTRRCLLDATRGLTEISKGKSPTVQFIHETVREFLRQRGLAQIDPSVSGNVEGESYEKLKLCCAKYIEQCDVDVCDNQAIHKDKYRTNRERLEVNFPLLEYATTNMFEHADIAQRSGKSQKDWIEQFVVPNRSLRKWIHMRNAFQPSVVRRYTLEAPLLYLMADMDLQNLLQLLIINGTIDELSSERYGTALQAACVRGQDETVRLLVQSGAPVNVRAGEHTYAIRAAMSSTSALRRKSLETIVRLLLDAGAKANVYSSSRNTKTLLCMAVEIGLEPVIKMLLDYEVHLTDRDEGCGDALRFACMKHDENTVRLLIDHGADVNATSPLSDSPLYLATECGALSIVQMLLDAGADVNAENMIGATALLRACERKHEEIARLLIQNGAKTNTKDVDFHDTLAYACELGLESVVQLLIETGVDINAGAGTYSDALRSACVRGHEKIARLLIENGADINAVVQNKSILRATLERGHTSIAQLLLDSSAGKS